MNIAVNVHFFVVSEYWLSIEMVVRLQLKSQVAKWI